MKNFKFILFTALIFFNICLTAIAEEITLIQGDDYGAWEDAGLLADTKIYSTEGGYSPVITLKGDSSTSVKSKKTRILVRLNLEDYEKHDFVSDGVLKYKINNAASDGTVVLYPINASDSDWKSAENSGHGIAAYGYACGALLARDSDERGGRLGYYADRKKDGINWTGGAMLGKDNKSFSSVPIAVSEFKANDTELTFVIPKGYMEKWKENNNPGFVMCLLDESQGEISLYSANADAEYRPSFSFNAIKNEFIIENCYVSNGERRINEIYSGMTALKITANVCNKGEVNRECICCAAVYDSAGSLKAVISDNTLLEPDEKYTFNLNFPEVSKAKINDDDILKIFFWDGQRELIPYLPANIIDYKIENINVNDFSGVSAYFSEPVLGARWGRMDFGWNVFEPEKGVFNEDKIAEYKENVLEANKNGVTILPILCYSTDWAADPSAYSYTYRNKTYKYSAAKTVNGRGWFRDVTVFDHNTRIEETDYNVERVSALEPFSNVKYWERYVRKVVSEFSKAPYNLEYFQIWNEANPISGFFYGDMEWYIENIHKPAAKIIREYGCKVVYGGWPACASYNEMFDLLDKTDAWNTIDVFDLHYFNSLDMIYVYNKALSRGIKAPAVWQTEVGFTQNQNYVAEMYPKTLYQSLKYRNEDENQFKLFYFTQWSPADPAAYGYNCCLYAGNELTGNGKAFKTFMSVLEGESIERYTSLRFDDNISNYGFLVDNKKAVVNAYESATGKNLILEGIVNPKNVYIIDCFGENKVTPQFIINNYSMSVKIPTTFKHDNFYVVIEAEKIIPTKNNISDFEYGSSVEDNCSIIAPGRWSYLNELYHPLQKGTGQGSFTTEEWARDNLYKKEHAWCLDSQGRIFADHISSCYNYTVDKVRAEYDMQIKCDFSANGYGRRLRIWKSKDKSKYTVGKDKELLYSVDTKSKDTVTLTIPSDELEEGNDIIFEVYSTQGEFWYVPVNINIDIGII